MASGAIYEELRARICFLDYPPGARLGEVDLAREFGVSRTPIRAVLGQLAAEGLVDIRRGVGTIVTEIDPPTLLQTLELRKELALLLSRVSPASDVTGLAVRVAEIRRVAEAMGAQMSVGDFARVNARFFEAMLDLTRNAPLRDVCTKLYYMTARLWVHSTPHLDFGREIEVFLVEMREVQAALERGDIEAVGHIRWLHLAASADRQRAQLEARGDGACRAR
jgi:DNA-binding GntR family transcriptional regulator